MKNKEITQESVGLIVVESIRRHTNRGVTKVKGYLIGEEGKQSIRSTFDLYDHYQAGAKFVTEAVIEGNFYDGIVDVLVVGSEPLSAFLDKEGTGTEFDRLFASLYRRQLTLAAKTVGRKQD